MENRWIRSRRWDLTWLILSAFTVPIAPLLYWAGLSASGVATIVMLLVGGPHVFVTFTRTNMDPKFVRRHRTYARLVFLIPVATAAIALAHTELFLTVFFAWASLHVLQQITYISNCYSNRQRFAPTPLERLFEYGVVFSCLYPFATVRMIRGDFMLDGRQLLVPEALLGPGLVATSFAVFGVFLVGWIVLTIKRYRRGDLHYGKTTLVGMTVGATLFIPLLPNLDVAFQGINTWHCIQYLALIWWMNRIRHERGQMEWPLVRNLSARGWGGFSRYWGLGVAVTVLVVAVVYLVGWAFPRIDPLLAYYVIGKSFLLAHYYYDTFLFTQTDELTLPVPAAAAA
jgi:hypothetical protein